MLRWHYRSRDERLIAFSNHEIYEGGLTTFPGAIDGEVLSHVLVDELPEAVRRGSARGLRSSGSWSLCLSTRPPARMSRSV